LQKKKKKKKRTKALQNMKEKVPKIAGSHISFCQMVGLIVIQHAYELAYTTHTRKKIKKITKKKEL